MKVKLIAKTQPLDGRTLEEHVVYIARVSSEDRESSQGIERLLRYMLENKHESPFDFVDFTFEIETSRDIGRQFLRHRTFAFQEHSQRYSDKVEFEDIEIRNQGGDSRNRQGSEEVFDPVVDTYFNTDSYTAVEVTVELVAQIKERYEQLIAADVAKECARGILPGCTRTSMNMKGNIRNWLNFLNLRMDKHAQKENREVANLIYEELKKEIPFIMKVWDERFTYYTLSRIIKTDYTTFPEEPFRIVKTLKEAKSIVTNLNDSYYPLIVKSIGIGGPDTVNFSETYNA
jgi:thymidylate synthase (FAD)